MLVSEGVFAKDQCLSQLGAGPMDKIQLTGSEIIIGE